MKALLIAKHWPELDATAAGRRTYDILNALNEFDFHCASACEFNRHSDDLTSQSIECHQIKLNDQSFNEFLIKLNPDLIIYDRFMIEEQYSWRVKESCPDAMTILDTSDLHCLRNARQLALNSNNDIDLNNDAALREIASIQRTDLTIMISSVEMQLLHDHFLIPKQKLHYYPFVIDTKTALEQLDHYPSFENRNNVMMIGNFLHEPNWDATRFMVNDIWPLVQKKLPNAQLHIYGAYHTQKHQQLHQPKKQVFLKGKCKDAMQTMGQYKINLAPLRFGAGMKGKVLEGWLTKTATIGTPVAFEAMTFSQDLGFTPTNKPEELAQIIIQAYEDSHFFETLNQNAAHILTTYFDQNEHDPHLLNTIKQHSHNLNTIRHNDFYQRLFWQKQMRAEQFMSKWIESKEKLKKLEK